jgi:hypothetical protein
MRQVLAVVCMAVVAVVGCNKSSNPSAPSNSNTVVSISLNSSSGALAFGAVETFTATATLALLCQIDRCDGRARCLADG